MDDSVDRGSSGRGTARRLPAGVADAAFASLATFAAGLSAVNLFNDVDRGVYAIFFTAFGLGVVLPWDLILIPAEVNAVSFPVVDRMRRARDTLRIGAPMAVLGSLAILIAALLSWSLTSSDVIWGLTITAAITTMLSPLQDHMRCLPRHLRDVKQPAHVVLQRSQRCCPRYRTTCAGCFTSRRCRGRQQRSRAFSLPVSSSALV